MASGWFKQIARSASRTLNAITGGDGAVTFSAGSYDRKLRGEPFGKIAVKIVDALPGNQPGHAREAWEWHLSHGLLTMPPGPAQTPPETPPKGA